jgi:hypothetical protein
MQAKREKLTAFVDSCVSELEKYFAPHKSDMGRAARFVFENLQPRTSQLLEPDKLAMFRSSQPFAQLVEFVMTDRQLVQAILGKYFDLSLPSDRDVFQRVVEIFLFRGLVAVHHSSTTRVERVMAFVDFLGLGEVERVIVVPLDHLDLEQESYDLGGFGVLRAEGKMPDDIQDSELFSRKHCFLRFSVKTKKYFGATEFPLVEQIRNKIAAVRMAANPFVSFNHFSISHVHPWEEPLGDEAFCDRFYGSARRVIIPRVDSVKVSLPMAEEARKLYDICSNEKWKVISPWRLALNRLDDAIFRIESGSPDALLDIVIGLESVLVEAQSAQESTHKVAVRAARFLESDTRARPDLFRTVKRLYALRSKIAHGKSLGIDDEAMKLLNEGVRLLTKVLRRMLEADVTELDLSHFDLS